MELHKSSYRIIKSQWGIAIDITGNITSFENHREKAFCKKIDDGLWIKIIDTLTHIEEEHIYNSLKKISKAINIASPYKLDTLIIFYAIEYNPCDYQPEGLIPAINLWISDTLKIDTPKVEVRFNKNINKYEFNYY